jgi:hypothetical protein
VLGRASLLVVSAVSALALLAATPAGADEPVPAPPPEAVLPTPAVEGLAKLPTPWMQKALRSLHTGLAPAKKSRARIVARLKLTLPSGVGHVWFLTYRNQRGQLCAITFQSQPGSSAWATGGLPCVGSCPDVCGGASTIDHVHRWLAWSGTVPSRADGARFTLADGARFRFPLSGPQVRGALERRVILVQLPSDQRVTVMEALVGETVIASQSYGS